MNPHTKNQILAHLAEAQRLLVSLDGPDAVALWETSYDLYIKALRTL